MLRSSEYLSSMIFVSKQLRTLCLYRVNSVRILPAHLPKIAEQLYNPVKLDRYEQEISFVVYIFPTQKTKMGSDLQDLLEMNVSCQKKYSRFFYLIYLKYRQNRVQKRKQKTSFLDNLFFYTSRDGLGQFLGRSLTYKRKVI